MKMMFGSMVLTATFAPRDLTVIIDRTAEAIRRLREKQEHERAAG